MKDLYYHCAECLKPCRDVERDFGIGSYEYFGAVGFDSRMVTVSHCCDGELLDPDQYLEYLAEQEEDDE